MHVKDSENKRFITEDEYKDIKLELSFGQTKDEIDNQEKEDNIYHNYILSHKTPEQIILYKTESHFEKLKAMFQGSEIQALEANETLSESQFNNIVLELNDNSPTKFYAPYVLKDGTKIMVEHLRAQPANILSILKFFINDVQPIQTEVR